MTTLAGVFLNLSRYDRRRIDGIWMNDGDVTATIQKLLGTSYEARVKNNCISVWRVTLFWPAARSSMRSATRSRCRGFASPNAACARACWFREMREDGALRAC